MRRQIHIAKNSLLHFAYNCACVLLACAGVGIMRTWGDDAPIVFWMGAAAVIVAWMAYRWQNDPSYQEWDGTERRRRP